MFEVKPVDKNEPRNRQVREQFQAAPHHYTSWVKARTVTQLINFCQVEISEKLLLRPRRNARPAGSR